MNVSSDAAATRYVVWVEFDLHPERRSEFLTLVRANAASSLREEPGCHQFDVLEDERDGGIALYEIYQDRAAFEQHLTMAHFKSFDLATAAMVRSKTVRTFTLSVGAEREGVA